VIDFTDYQWAYAVGDSFGRIMESLIPPSFVLLVNAILLFLMNRSSKKFLATD
jgi:hypothetical protein